ncbi:MAG: maleylpyruvate isomerase N-terminal domain-containing protein, partial [Anaerolineae bacterium]|nr:maleylpyruvate isomerase N-terminal domain-containing protein [Anaerolineae bacterium]
MANNPEVTTAELLSRLQESWDSLQAFVGSLTDEQITRKTDTAGWTVKDHLMHLVVWEDGFDADISGEDRRERMGVPPEVWHPEAWHTEGGY